MTRHIFCSTRVLLFLPIRRNSTCISVTTPVGQVLHPFSTRRTGVPPVNTVISKERSDWEIFSCLLVDTSLAYIISIESKKTHQKCHAGLDPASRSHSRLCEVSRNDCWIVWSCQTMTSTGFYAECILLRDASASDFHVPGITHGCIKDKMALDCRNRMCNPFRRAARIPHLLSGAIFILPCKRSRRISPLSESYVSG
jgi:hypothetical protein